MGLRMQSYKKFFLPYYPTANINYIYLLTLYKIAERAEERDIKQDIGYSSIKELLNKINKEDKVLSESTLRRMLDCSEYKYFFTVKVFGAMKWIILNNNFTKSAGKKEPFVVLCPKTYNLLIQKKDNLLAKYTIYLKYMCGLNGGSTDFIANQFLTTFNYSISSNNLKDKISKYNSLLEKERIISIKRNQLEDGKRRNTYTFIDL